MDEPEKTQKIWRMCVACWISKATRGKAHERAGVLTLTRTHVYACIHARWHTQTHIHRYVLLTADGKSGLAKRVSMFSYMYITCRVLFMLRELRSYTALCSIKHCTIKHYGDVAVLLYLQAFLTSALGTEAPVAFLPRKEPQCPLKRGPGECQIQSGRSLPGRE